MRKKSITPVVLCGGSGTRLWPKSRRMLPKQLQSLTGEQTMLQQTLERVRGYSKPIVVCNEDHRFMVAQQAREIGFNDLTIIIEPVGRNTAPAIAYAALVALQNGGDTNLLILPADHLLDDIDQFHSAVDEGCQLSSEGRLVTFGIVPNAPETGYGYIKAGENNQGVAKPIVKFIEKPTLEKAVSYLGEGGYFWNAGMFLFGAETFLNELAIQSKAIAEASEVAVKNALIESDFVRLHKDDVEKVPEDSIDYAVMEKTKVGDVIPLKCGWSDVGSWSSLWEALEKDDKGNASIGDVILEDCTNSLVFGEDHLVAAVGIDNLIVVDTKNATLVAPKDRAQDVKAIVSKLKVAGRDEHELHREVVRPWGKYDSIGSGPRFQVKRITVNPGASLSLQMHHHRAEHWVVVSGTAIVERDGEEIMLSENESVYIPIGAKHRLKNPGILPIELIEVQSGSYLGEDDIVRFEDIYGRTR
ncbi:mannose-1-phosphate guanylyltransferase/mannose-6-phosphate isomerase [Microbulbifer variabilis]|uniref:mannose-1-phosphate guanylyltransferase/mannose-6-phosphate isomerase n=1 Tax=Microbulbifer variabilis TaxID=266805 RepID=UPI001CFF12B3|nr:mannose-1-phosphate guanylyltransferase/mannose-6-phosphate isomerase [Microbulbifer variabilis]